MTVQEVFNKVSDLKAEQKGLKSVIKDAFLTSLDYNDSYKKMVEVKNEVKVKKEAIMSDFKPEVKRLEEIKQELESLNVMMSDLIINDIYKGNKTEVHDQFENSYQPAITAKFKKVK